MPDTSLFPPPPALFSGFDRSPASNATEQDADAGEQWCRMHPLSRPMTLDSAGKAALALHNVNLIKPAGFNGRLEWRGRGLWEGQTARNSPDRSIIGYPPLYAVDEHDPTRTGRSKTIYYEAKLLRASPNETLALGFAALPYPSFRMPGWHRGSLAVHGDDGHRFVNDDWGGKAFTDAFRRGDTYGIGMTFTPPANGGPRPRVEIFFTHNGHLVGQWDLHEETDSERDLPVAGLEGFHDLSCVVGTYDAVSFEVVFDPSKWMYKELQE